MELRVHELILPKSKFSKFNIVKMWKPKGAFIQLNTLKGLFVLKVEHYEEKPLNHDYEMYIPKTLMEDLNLTIGEVLPFIFLKTFESPQTHIHIELVEIPKCSRDIIVECFEYMFIRKFKYIPFNYNIRYHFTMNEYRFCFKIVKSSNGHKMDFIINWNNLESVKISEKRDGGYIAMQNSYYSNFNEN